MTYTQCKLKQGNAQQTAWIPTEFAKVGKFVILSKNRHAFERTWQVVSCGGTLPAEYVLEHERNYRTTAGGERHLNLNSISKLL